MRPRRACRVDFARAFRAAYGEPPGACLTRRRVERAHDLLRSATLTEVCHLVGFTGLGMFSRRFRELVGSSPSAYRAEQVRRGGPPPVPGCFLMAWAETARTGKRSVGDESWVRRRRREQQ